MSAYEDVVRLARAAGGAAFSAAAVEDIDRRVAIVEGARKSLDLAKAMLDAAFRERSNGDALKAVEHVLGLEQTVSALERRCEHDLRARALRRSQREAKQ